MSLETLWFILITVLWTGFFVLEGFDLGVGMLHGVVGRDEAGRRAVINTIGPLWDGNEVWLIVAAAGMFAAFPAWYATMFSGFYVVMVLLLAGLIVRGVSFEFRGKQDSARWRRTWDTTLTTGSVLVPLLLGAALGNLLAGVPINKDQEFTGSLVDLIGPYPLFVGLSLLLLCALHGLAFMTLKTDGEVEQRAQHLARRLAPFVAIVVVVLAFWTHAIADRGVVPEPVPGHLDRSRDRRRLVAVRTRRGLGIHRHHCDDRRDDRVDLQRPVPATDGVEHQLEVRPHGLQLGLGFLRPQGHDLRDGHPAPGCAGVPGLDLPRLPRQDPHRGLRRD